MKEFSRDECALIEKLQALWALWRCLDEFKNNGTCRNA